MSAIAATSRLVHRLSRIGVLLRFEGERSEQIHPIFQPGAKWEDKDEGYHTNQVSRVKTPDGGDWFVKRPHENPIEAHIEPSARHIMRHLGFAEVPPAERAVDPSTGHGYVVSPWVDLGGGTLRNQQNPRYYHNDALKQRLNRYGPQRITNLLTAHWLVHALDRNAGNYGFDAEGKLHPIDYGETFSIMPWHNYNANSDMRTTRNTSPHDDHLFHAANDNDILNFDSPLNKDFLAVLKSKQPMIESTFWEDVAPHLPPDDLMSASTAMQEKFSHLDRLLEMPNPRLADLPRYRGNKKI